MKYPLHDAILRADVGGVREALDQGADPEQLIREDRNWYDRKSPLELALHVQDPVKQWAITSLLVGAGVCDYETCPWDWDRPYEEAHASNQHGFLKAVKDTPRYRMFARKMEGDLWKACENRSMKDIQRLLERGVDPNAEIPVKSGRKVATSTPLEAGLLAADVFDLLVSRGAILPSDPARQVAMIGEAARGGRIEILERLERMGATRHLGGKVPGPSPLFQAAIGARPEAIDWLLERGVSPNKTGRAKVSPIDGVLAADVGLENKIALGKQLIDAGAKPVFAETRWRCEYDHREPFIAGMKQYALDRIAQESRPDDLASPEEALSRRGRGRFM